MKLLLCVSEPLRVMVIFRIGLIHILSRTYARSILGNSVPPFPFFRALVFPLVHPCLDKLDFLLLCVDNGLWWELGGRLIGEEPVFVPVVNGVVNQNEWLADGALSSARAPLVRMRCGRPPWIPFPVEEGETRVGDVVTAVFIDALDVRRSGNVEAVAADL
jgi:hypothetical protein